MNVRRVACTDSLPTDRGASLVEYALLLALIAMVCLTAVTAFGGSVSEQFSETNSLLEAA